MKICIIAEGSYPYITGGVSSWIQMLISNMTEHEFIIYAIGAEKKSRGKFVYNIPENVSHIEEVFLDNFLDLEGRHGKHYNFEDYDIENIKHLISGEKINWNRLFALLRGEKIDNIIDFFMSREFFDILTEVYKEEYGAISFNEFFWTIRSMLLPLFFIIKNSIPEAHIYHSVSTGYAGIIGSLAKYLYDKPYLLTEHGIYTREREEEIIKSNWVKGYFKDMWIKFFYNLSNCSYERSDQVVTLFDKNREIEIELGCEGEKIKIIPNGVNASKFADIPQKSKDDNFINIGAIVRVVPIKDLKTMIQSFAIVKDKIDNAKLFIMGPTDEDEEYYMECLQFIDMLEVEDVIFTGRVNIKEYVGKMDLMLLSSISEGQPLAILEGMACGKPFVATDVGSCRELIYGKGDIYGESGIVVPVMNYEKMARAIIHLCENTERKKRMGENAFQRVSKLYTIENFLQGYKDIYTELHGEE